ncbi:hypothetical protein ACFL9U_15535 [Thermodesulfobacteriota bacterium]
MNEESGFTLVEVVASLVLVGFLTVFAGIGLVTFTKGYMFAMENTHMSQKSQIAMGRMTRELIELLDVTDASNTYVTIDSLSGARTIGLDDQKIKIAETGIALSAGDILIDDVGGFSLSYYSGAQSWSQGMDIRLLSAIQVQLTLSRADSGVGSVVFSTTVHPRNTNNLGGAPPTSSPPTQADYCFVTAAMGSGPPKPASFWPNQFRHINLLIISLAALVATVSLILHTAKPRKKSLRGISPKNTGSVVIGLIIAIVIISALGAAMLPLTSTSVFQQVWANSTARSYFLAESGLRYAASEYLNAGDNTAKNQKLLDLHEQTFTLKDDNGQFQLEIYPYFFKTPSDSDQIDTDKLKTEIPGGFPPDLTLSFGRLKIGDNFYDYTSIEQSDRNITFWTSEKIPYVQKDTDVLSVAESSGVLQTISKGGNLTLKTGTGSAFPLRNGTFSVDGHIYSYEENDLDNNQLVGIKDPDDPDMTSFTVASGTNVILQKFVKLYATGTYGQAEIATDRQLIYHLPLPFGSEEKVTFVDTFEDLSAWEAPTFGAFEIQTIGGDKAVKVTGTSSVSGAPKAALIAWDWSQTDVDLAAAHRLGSNFMLSYDAQVKVGFTSTPIPTQGFDPEPIPKYFVSGLSFRLDNSNNSYGLAFLRGSNSAGSPYDNIDDGIVPVDDTLLIALWQATSSGTNRKWLAYKDLSEQSFYDDDIESGTNGWTASGLWHISAHRSHSSANAWYYGREGFWDYDTGANSGALTSPGIYLTPGYCYTLSYWSWIQTEKEEPLSYDLKYVQIYDGSEWTDLIPPITSHLLDWHETEIDLSEYSGETIKIGFFFDTVDAQYNDYEGWYIDDVKISVKFPLEESTLLVRLQEAAAISFSNGSPTAVLDGERVVGQSSDATATVEGNPILSSGSWSGGDAAGTMTLRNVSGSFQTGESIYVVGSPAQAIVQGSRERDNYIRAYYGYNSSCGTPNNDPLDFEKLANPRGEANWPPDEVADWAAENDYFHLVQWDAINGSVSSLTLTSSVDEPNAILRSSQSELLTPTSGTFNRPEIGLHAFGHGSTNVYFDDFAVQAEILSISRAAPVQE